MAYQDDPHSPREDADQSIGEAAAPADLANLEVLVDELARVFCERDEASLLARDVGVPPADVPDFKTARVFWSEVTRVVRDGKVMGGAKVLANAAAKRYPANAIFNGEMERVGTSAIPKSSTQPTSLASLRCERWRWPWVATAAVGLVVLGAAVSWPGLLDTEPDAVTHTVTTDPAADPQSGQPPEEDPPPPTDAISPSTDTAPVEGSTRLSTKRTAKPRPGRPTSSPLLPITSTPDATSKVDPRRWKVQDVLEDSARFANKRYELDSRAPRQAILTFATLCDPPTTSTSGPRCLVRDDPDAPGGHYCFTRDVIPIGTLLCIHPQGTKAEPR